MKKLILIAVVAVLATGLYACGGSSSGGGTGGTDFSSAETTSVSSSTADTDFASNGKFTISFVAHDGDGNAILSETGTEATGLTCTISTPASTDCTLSSISSTQPSSASANIMGAVLIDDSGSMAVSDTDRDRDPAADAFLDSVCDCTSGASCSSTDNRFGVFDFAAGGNLGNTQLRDLLTADGASVNDLPFPGCSDTNVGAARTAISDQITETDATPLYTALKELCDDIVAASASGGDLEGLAPAILLLSDGYPTDTENETDAIDCITTNSITTCTVGLGEGSELQSSCICTADSDCVSSGAGDVCEGGRCAFTTYACTTDADCSALVGYDVSCNSSGHCESYYCAAIDVLKNLADSGNCVYASATDAAALQPIFDAIGTAVSEGQNLAIYVTDPVPAAGTTVEGTITVGNATATFSFVAR